MRSEIIGELPKDLSKLINQLVKWLDFEYLENYDCDLITDAELVEGIEIVLKRAYQEGVSAERKRKNA